MFNFDNINHYYIIKIFFLFFSFFYLPGVTAIGNCIYAVGGYDGTSQLNSVERYNVDENRWEFVKSMSSRRSALSVDVVAGKLYALGECRIVRI